MSQSRREALRRQQEAQARAKRNSRIVLIGAIIAGLVLVAVFGTVLFQGMSAGQSTSTPPNATQAKDGIVVNPGKAKQGAPVVTLYLDYQCPVCKQFEETFGGVLNDMAGKGEIELQYHTMTFLDLNLRNDSSKRAGIAAACADIAGKYPDYHNTVFANQPLREGDGYTTTQLRSEFASSAGIVGDKLTAFQQCYDSKATSGFVDGTNELASKAGVTATPTLRVNGKTVPNNAFPTSNPPALRALILGQ